MKAFLKKVPGLSFLKTKCYDPLRKGYFRYYFLYIRKDKPLDIRGLKNLGITELKPMSYMQWRIGKGKDHAFRRYYTGVFQGTKCFIKIGKNDATVKNELEILSQTGTDGMDFSPRLLIGAGAFAENTAMLAVEYKDDLMPIQTIDTEADFEEVCRQFVDILDGLKKAGIVHGDIHKGNMMLHKGKLLLLDYGISKIGDKPNGINYLHRPGTFYRETMGVRVYDDAYSFLKMVEKMDLPEEYMDNQYIQQIRSRVDRASFSVLCK